MSDILVDVRKLVMDFGCEVDARTGTAKEPCSSSADLEHTVGRLESEHATLLTKVIQMRTADYSLGGMADKDLYEGLSGFFSLTQVPRRLLTSFAEHERTLIEQQLEHARTAVGTGIDERVASFNEVERKASKVREKYEESKVAHMLEELKDLVDGVATNLAIVDWTMASSCGTIAKERAMMYEGIKKLVGGWKRASDREAWNVSEDVWHRFRGGRVSDLVDDLVEHMKRTIWTMDAAMMRWPDPEHRDRMGYEEFLEFSFDDYQDLSRGEKKGPYTRARLGGWCDAGASGR